MILKTYKIHLLYIGILFFLGGLFCAGVQFAGAFLLVMGFAVAPVIAYGLNIKGKLIGVLVMDAGLIIGASVRIAYWQSLHGFESLVDWKFIFFLVILAILVSGTMVAIFFLIERIWPTRTNTPSEQSENERTNR